MKRIVIAMLCLFLVGCAGKMDRVWEHPKKDDAQFQDDLSKCRGYLADKSQTADLDGADKDRIMKECLQRYGWEVVRIKD